MMKTLLFKLDSIGAKLFLYVLGGAFIGLGGMAYFFHQILEHRLEKDIQRALNNQVTLIDHQLTRMEDLARQQAMVIAMMQKLGIAEADRYNNLVLAFFQQRPPILMGTGFGQMPFHIVYDREWFGPYFHIRPEDSQPSTAQSSIRYMELFTEDNYPQQNYYREPLAKGKALWLEPYNWHDIIITTFALPIVDDDKATLGMVWADVSLTALEKQVSDTVVLGTGYFTILSQAGNLLFYPPDPHIATQMTHYQQVPMLSRLWPRWQNQEMGTLHDNDTFFAYQRIRHTGWIMLAAVSHSQVISWPVFRITALGALGAGVALILVVNLFVRRLNRRLRPILHGCRTLIITPTSISTSPQNLPPSPEEGDEIEVLTHSFNRMTRQLKESFATLAKQETQLKQFLEAMPVGIFVMDAMGQLLYLNSMGQELLGKGLVTEAKIEELPAIYQTYLAGTDQLYPLELQPLRKALLGETSSCEDMEIHQGSRIIPLEVWGTPIFDDQGNILYAMVAFRDITMRRNAERERTGLFRDLGELNATLAELNHAYERFVPRQLLSLLEKDSVIEIQLGDQIEKNMTVLFSDIRGFTTMSDEMTPLDIFEFLNNYLGQMEPIILRHHGVIDKYIGDAIMALFPSCPNDAVNAALGMLSTLSQYNQLLQRAQLPLLHTGIGLNTGPLMVGMVGGYNRMDGTVIADAVNVASRVEALTKIYQAPLLLTEQTYLNLSNPTQYHSRILDSVTVRGKSTKVTIYEIYDTDPPNIIGLKDATREEFQLGFMLYHSGEVSDALPFFEKVSQLNPQDKAARIYLQRCQELCEMRSFNITNILVVDDSIMNTKIMSHILTTQHFNVLVAHDGETALQMATARQPHLILLDVVMPGIDGFETCRRLKAQLRTRNIPVIFMTGLTDKENRIKGFEVGAVDYITKPFYREEVLARIKVHLSNRYLKQQLVEKI